VRARTSPDWRPLNGSLSARSVTHALSILGAPSASVRTGAHSFRWLIGQRYVLANPFAGVKVREATGVNVLDTQEEAPERPQSRTLLIAPSRSTSRSASRSASRLPMTGVAGRQRTGAIGNPRSAR
jgi:hypothetical protein